VAVVGDPEALQFIAEHGGRVYVYAVGAGLKRVSTVAPDDTSIRFDRIDGDGFQLFVESDFPQPQTWNLVLRRFPRRHLGVLWDGDQPGYAPRIDPTSGLDLL
jgi:hypothetical protein